MHSLISILAALFKRWRMRRRRRTEILVETDQVTVIRRAGKVTRAWCPECEAETQMITPEEAAFVAKVNTRTIYRWLEVGEIHFLETYGGLVLLCSRSLLARASDLPCDG